MNIQVNIINEAITNLGGASALARAVSAVSGRKVTHWNVHRWKEGRVPAHYCLAVEKVTGISRHLLRPDVFGADQE
ncbi:YdaS family helix-turn-helix protein [Chromatium okenii]|uniref:transcriptional regulator n=1 Tax=Chromatium okenii TaxID=61644 RepID=UPI0026EB6DFB|nr:YdaS family helix-turn-helix protein [Chromatium okenii]MBV5310755.1 helix-turn-helix domain-containing protein [Chromatium okenii]